MAKTTKPVTSFTVLLGPEDGSAVTYPDDAVNYLPPARIVRMAGGGRLDYVEFIYDLAETGERLENIQTPTGFSRQVEIRKYEEDGSYAAVFWGDLTTQSIDDGETQGLRVTAAVYPYHFGKPVFGHRYYDPRSDAEVTIYEELVFNPNIDGVVRGNRSSRRDETDMFNVAADPESFRTAAAATYQGETIHVWTLAEAINYLCWLGNPDQLFIDNPDIFDPDTGDPDPIFDEAIDPENERLPRGQYLPALLDALLPKYGYGWYLTNAVIGTGPTAYTKAKITVFRLNAGTEKQLHMQAFGSDLELDTEVEGGAYTDTKEFSVTTDVGKAVNTVYVDGGPKQWEVCIELYRGWPEADDALTEADLDKSEPTSQYNTANKKTVWRKWVGNEAGDYCSTRTTVQPIPAAPRDWSDLGVKIPRRREIEDCLTKRTDGEQDDRRLPPFLEYSTDNGTTWLPVPHDDWAHTIYKTEIAVEFTGDQPPGELIAAGDNAKLRVTCTITGDDRITHDASRQATSPNLRDAGLHLDVSSRFAYRQIKTTDHGSGAYYKSAVNPTAALPADTRDDSTSLQTFAEYARGNAESAEMDGRFVLFGIDLRYGISDLITKVAGREISLDRNSPDAETGKYLQVLGVELDENAQTTTLVTQPRELDPNYRKGARPNAPARV